MPTREKLTALQRLAEIDIRLLFLAWNLKRSRRTYLSYATLFSLASNFMAVSKQSLQPIQVAEFGVGRGGSAIFLAWLVNQYQGKLSLYDVFGQIPAPTEQDGERAASRYDAIIKQEGEKYYGNIINVLELVLRDLHKVCKPDRIDIVKGKYEETLPTLTDIKKFNLVHIDCDWYESSKAVYSYLQSRLRDGAIIQIDDYSTWDGSKRAFQEATWLNNYQSHLVDGALVIDISKIKDN